MQKLAKALGVYFCRRCQQELDIGELNGYPNSVYQEQGKTRLILVADGTHNIWHQRSKDAFEFIREINSGARENDEEHIAITKEDL